MTKSSQYKKKWFVSTLIIIGILIIYSEQMAPSPILNVLGQHFGIGDNDALLNLSVSIIFPMMILASIAGGLIEQKIGTSKLFVWTLSIAALGMMINYVATSYIIFLLGRAIFGVGMGLGIPFMGSAIMNWYSPKQREFMITINSLFPYIGTVLSFCLVAPLYQVLGNSWKNTLGVGGFVAIAIGILWVWLIKSNDLNTTNYKGVEEKNLYLSLWLRRDIKLLCIAFICDFFCYSYLAVVLPTYLMEAGKMTAVSAGLWAAIAFPGVGIIGSTIGGMAIAKSGKRKPSMALGQILKFIGISMAGLGGETSVWIIIGGIVLFGLGNSIWMPGMFTIPMELEDMNSTRVGAAFALISSCGFAAGFISPIIGGWITNLLMRLGNGLTPIQNHLFGVKWSLVLFGFTNLIAYVCILFLKETGTPLSTADISVIDSDCTQELRN